MLAYVRNILYLCSINIRRRMLMKSTCESGLRNQDNKL